MPEPFDGADASTREALLLSAREAFAERGFDAASVRTITAGAGANLGAITYHFGSKRALYDAVVDGAVGPLADRLTALIAEPRPALERVAAVVRTMFEYFDAHPDTPRLLLQELANGRMLPDAALRHMGRLFAALTTLVSEGQAEGTMRPGEPRLMALTIIAHPVHANLFRSVLRDIAGVDLAEAPVRARVIANAEAFVRGGLAVWPEEGGA
ncbi:MAG TPA: TetR/AcrR family transcriptional regulator [Longimicrobiales bacterium]|nr:TetR/AcrR family transcriptional regulator [Longimicrobiales bacterium]